MTLADHYDALTIYRPHNTTENQRDAHKSAIAEWVQPLGLPLDAAIADIGCGPAVSVEVFAQCGYTNVTGYGLGPDTQGAIDRGLKVELADQSAIPEADNDVDFIYARQILEHSPAPLLTLREWHRILKPGGGAYIQIPIYPEGWVTKDHLCVAPRTVWRHWMTRVGFDIMRQGYEANEYAWIVRKK